MFFKKFKNIDKKAILERLSKGYRIAQKEIQKKLKPINHDLPLDKNEGTRFLILLIAFMSFLSVLSLSGTITLNTMTTRWSSGLENKVTIEISVETKKGHILSQETIREETLKLYKMLSTHKSVKSANILSAEDIQELLSPWLGKNMSIKDLPLPGLIAVELNDTDEEGLNRFTKDIEETSHYAQLETHREWLSDLIQFTKTLKTLTFIITLIISAITITAVAYAMRTRLALHHDQVALLHHMGASDSYIARQFQNHALSLSLKGGLAGTLAGIALTFILMLMSHNTGTDLIPTMHIKAWDVLSLCTVPFFICTVSVITSHLTLLHNLTKMP